MRNLVWISILSGCAVTANTCPTNTKLVTASRPDGRAEWCTVTDAAMTSVPAPGRSFDSTLGLVGHPEPMPTGVEGPYTSWYANGSIASHGKYVRDGSRSVPDGMWAFWYPDGRRRTVGIYHRGQPVGCFASFDEKGEQTTGFVEGDQLHVAACTPPPGEELAVVEGRVHPPKPPPPWADVSIQGFFGPNEIGARDEGQIHPHPGMTAAFDASARVRLGPLRVGPTVGMRVGNDSDYFALAVGATIAWRLPSFHPRVDADISAQVAIQRIDVTAQHTMNPATAFLRFTSPLPAIQFDTAIELSPIVSALVGVRVDGIPRSEVERDVHYCDQIRCYEIRESWDVGGFAYGINVGVRWTIR